MTPTARTLQKLRQEGYTSQVVEKWNAHAHIRQDLFGCIDVLAVHSEQGTMGVQACAGSSLAARIAKSCAEPRLVTWLQAGNRFECWGWRKLKVKRGGKAVRWEVRRVNVRLVNGTPQPEKATCPT